MNNFYYNLLKQKIKRIPFKTVAKKLNFHFVNNFTQCPFHESDKLTLQYESDTNTAYCYNCYKRFDNIEFVKKYKDCKINEVIEWFEKQFPELKNHSLDDIIIPKSDIENYDELDGLDELIEDETKKEIIIKENNDDSILSMADELDKILNYKVESYKLNRFECFSHNEIKACRKGLITIGGLTNTGKTSLVTALGIDILKNNMSTGLLYFSLDDCKYLTGNRIISQLVNENTFNNKNMDASNISKMDIDILKRIVMIDNIGTFDIEEITCYCELVKQKTQCSDLIIVFDYLQIIRNDSGSPIRDFINTIVTEIKKFQKATNYLVIIISQLARNSKSEYEHTFRETSEIENQSDVCIIISDARNDDKVDIMLNGQIHSAEKTIFITKNKLGRKIQFKFMINTNFNWKQIQTGADDENH